MEVWDAPDALGVGDILSVSSGVVSVVGVVALDVSAALNAVVGTAAGKPGMVSAIGMEPKEVPKEKDT